MPNQSNSIWKERPEISTFAKRRKRDGIGPSKIRDEIAAKYDVRLTERQVRDHLRDVKPPKGEGDVVRVLEEGDPLKDQVRKYLLKHTASYVDIANKFDISPRRAEQIVTELQQAGVSVAIHDAPGSEARLMVEPSKVQSREQLRIVADKFYGDTFRFEFGAVSDTHLGSKFYRPEVLNAIYDNFAAHGIKHVFHGGNYIEGEKHDKVNLLYHGMQGQIDYFVRAYPQRKGLTTYFVAGDDHEGWYQQREGIDIGRFTETEARAQGRTDLINLGYMEADVAIKIPGGGTCKLRVMHAGGGSSYAISYSAQKIIEAMDGGEKPHILLIGHFHKSDYLPAYRNVHCIQMGTTKAQDTFMRKQRLAAHVGGWRCAAVIGKDGSVREFTATYLPFFNTGYYESMAVDGANGEVTFIGANETYNVAK
jgi:hypothetical protein